jgi:hypothetical protein
LACRPGIDAGGHFRKAHMNGGWAAEEGL